MKTLAGKIALVTGATRGIGKGIAIGLGEAGATVYITGRTLSPSGEESGTLTDTQTAVEAVGGVCFPVQVDHSDDEQVRQLFQRIDREQNGRLDVLVNNVFAGVSSIAQASGQPFWENEPDLWDAVNNVGLRSHYIASLFAARLMSQRQQGLICTISSWGGMSPIFGVAYGVGKAACDRLAAEMAQELKSKNVTSIALWPGIVGTEAISRFADQMSQEDIDPQTSVLRDRYNWETPLFTGRVIAALAAETNVQSLTGKVQIVAEVAQRYNLLDRDGNRPVSLRSLRFILPAAIPALRQASWLVPDFKVPWWLLLLGILPSPKI